MDPIASLLSSIPEWLQHQRWFGAKTRAIGSVEIVDWAAISKAAVIAFVRVNYAEGEPDTYQLPLAVSARGNLILSDAVEDEDFRQALLRIIESDASLAIGIDASITGRHSGLFAITRGPQNLTARVSSAEQSNTNILYDDRMILKLFRRLQPGENPDVEIGRFLTEVANFPHIPRFLGEITLSQPGEEPTSLAMLQELVPNQGDGWQWTLNSLATYYAAQTPDTASYLKAATLLGRRTAEMHLALATETTDEAFRAEPLTSIGIAEEAKRIREQINRALDTLQQALPTLTGEIALDASSLLSRRPFLQAQADAILSQQSSGKLIRIHGDYHLGQVLRTQDDFVLLDFEGEPARSLAERRRKQSPLKDVAGMLRSFAYAAAAGLQQHKTVHPEGNLSPEPWCSTVSTAFLTAYLQTVTTRPGLLPNEPLATALLNTYILEKASYELVYELNNRPTWVRIPLAGLLALSRTAALPDGR